MVGYSLLAMYAFGKTPYSGKEIHRGRKISIDKGVVYPYKYEDSLSKSNGVVTYNHFGDKIATLNIKNNLLTLYSDKYSPRHTLAIKSGRYRINQLIRPMGLRIFQKNYELYFEANTKPQKWGNKPIKITVPAKFRG